MRDGRLSRRLYGSLAGTSARRGVAAIAGGAAVGQVITIAAAPLLSRVYSPTDFGVFSVVSSFVLVFASASAMRFELAIPLPGKDGEAYKIALMGIVSSCICMVFGLSILLWQGREFATALNEPLLWPWLLMVPPMGALGSIYLVLNQLAVRKHRYNSIGRRNLLYSAATVFSQLALGVARFASSGGLIVGLAVGQLVGAASMMIGSGLVNGATDSAARDSGALRLLRRYRRFPLIAAPAGVINAAGVYAPAILMVAVYGASFGGLFGLAQRIMQLPIGLLGAAVGQVYVGELSRALRAGGKARATLLFYGTSRRLLLLSGVCALTVFLFGPWVFASVFGPQWRESGECARALAVVLFAQMVAAPVSPTLLIFERQGLQLVWDLTRLVAVAGTILGCSLLHLNGITAVWVYSCSAAIMYAISWLMSRSMIARHGRLG